jgi:hypothetical protein
MKTVKPSKASKGARRDRRQTKERRDRDGARVRVQPLGGTMDPDDLARLTEAFETFDPAAPWRTVAPTILPVLKRAWHPYPADAEPIHIHVPPGIPTGFGIDVGPGFSHVTPQLVERWGIDAATLLATALENLRAIVRVEPPAVDRFRHEGVDIQVIQGQGWGSALILLPDVLQPLIGPAPRVLLVPVRNTLIALPAAVDPELVLELWSAIAGGAHDALDLDPLRWTGTAVVAYQDMATRGLPN